MNAILSVVDLDRLATFPLFVGLTEADLAEVASELEVVTLAPGEALFHFGEPFKQRLFVHDTGELELRQGPGDARPVASGEALGIISFLDGAPYTASVVARSRATVLALPADRWQALEHRHPLLMEAVNRAIAERIRARSAGRQVLSGAMADAVRAVMTAPLATCEATLSLREAHRRMEERRIGSLGVVDGSGGLLGMLTFRILVDALLRGEARPETPVAQVTRPAQTIAADAPLWEAEERQQHQRVKYLVVCEGRAPLGMVSQTDILQHLVRQAAPAMAAIEGAADLAALASLKARAPAWARQALERHRHVHGAVRELSDTHLAMQRRCVALTFAALAEQAPAGYRPSSEDFALFIMGSGGRREMLLNPDQDNGLILADRVQDPAVRAWYQRFAEAVNQNLDRLGYVLCPGNIMARNPLFHKRLAEWTAQVDHVTEHPTPKAARWANVAFDLETVYGNDALTDALRRHLLAALAERPRLLRAMVEDDAEGRAAIGLFNRLLTDRDGKVDIKRNGLRIIADGARIFALRAGIRDNNTDDRLAALLRQGALKPDLADSVRAAYEELLELLLTHQLQQQERGEPLDKLVQPAALSRFHQETLRLALRAVKGLQEELQGAFGAAVE
jgi:CBS domain-containing protein